MPVVPTNDLDSYKYVSKAISVDVCANKGKEQAHQYHSVDKSIFWTWYSSTTECVIYVFNDDPAIQLQQINPGIICGTFLVTFN